MSVAAHLQIRLEDYDARIRTFIPGYEAMLEAAAGALAAVTTASPHVVDLGTGTGALATRCLKVRRDLRLTAVDEDPEILALARQRLELPAGRATFVHANFVDFGLPPCDAVVASLALHHIRTDQAKRRMYRACRSALKTGGLLVLADCCPSADPKLAVLQRDAWRKHLLLTYSGVEADGYFAAWAVEDVYFPLAEELVMLRDAAFLPEVVWRTGPMAVIAGRAL
jgi:tRNA (cmo5U34)-methyltransferase